MGLTRTQITEAVDKAMESISKMDHVHYSLLEADPDDMVVFKKEVEKTVEELFVTINNVRAKEGNLISVYEAMPHLPHDRIELIRNSLRNQTFVMSVEEKGTTKEVQVTRGGEKYLSSITLPSLKASELQIASIIVEVVALMLNVIGIDVPENPKGLAKAIAIAKKAFSAGSALSKYLKDLKLSYGHNDFKGMAMAMIHMVIELFQTGFFVKIAKALLSKMHWYDWLLTAAKIAAFITAMIATGGLAEIAEIVSILLNAVDFLRKLANLNMFEKYE